MTSEVRIGELAHSSKGSFKIGPFGSSLKKEDLSDEGIPVAGIENVLPNQFVPRFRRFISEKKFAELSDYKIEPDDILVSTMGTIGRAAIAPENIETAIIDSHLFRIRLDTRRIYPAYLCYAINGYRGLKQQLKQQARGAIMDGLNTTILKECSIPLFPLDEQKHIAAILDKADRLRRQRRFAQTLSDSFLQSVFIKMFGDPVHNPRNWETFPLNNLCSNITDGTHDTPERVKKGIPFITSKNVRPYKIDLSNLEFVSEETHNEIIKRCNPQRGDVLYTNIGVNVGNAVANNLTFSFSLKNVALLQPDKSKLSSHFLESLLNYEPFKNRIIDISSQGGAQKFISLEVLRTTEAIAPPLVLQENFAATVQKFERVRRQQREATRQAEHLFQTLLHRAFRGEL